jgi:TfoX/Sxy family transcriptional regulator of competence genes
MGKKEHFRGCQVRLITHLYSASAIEFRMAGQKGINMSSDASFVEFIAEQMSQAGSISTRKMFGEYAVYCDGKVVALVCDNRLFVKPTAGGRAYIGDVVEAPPYPGAKMYFLIEDAFEDRDWI